MGGAPMIWSRSEKVDVAALNAETDAELARMRGRSSSELSVLGGPQSEAMARAAHTVAGAIQRWQADTPVFPSMQGSEVVEYGLKQNEAFFRCVDLIGNAIAQGRLQVTTADGAEIPNHPMIAALSKHTDHETLTLWLKMLVSDVCCYGGHMFEAVPGKRSGMPVEIHRMNPACTAIEPGRPDIGEPQVKRYWYNIGGEWWPIETSRVVHFKYFPDPGMRASSRFFGLAPIFSALRNFTLDRELVDLIVLTLQNRAPQSVMQIEGKAGEPPVFLSDQQTAHVKQMWARTTGGRDPSGIAVLPSNITVKTIGQKFNELDIAAAAALPQDRIYNVHGVPHSIGGSAGSDQGSDPTHANADAQYKMFLETTVSYWQGMVADVLQCCFLPMFPRTAGQRVSFDTSMIPVLRRSKIEALKDITPAFSGGLVAREIAQKLVGVELHGPNVIYRPDSVGGIVDADAKREDFENEPPPGADAFTPFGDPAAPPPPPAKTDKEPEIDDEDDEDETE